MFSLIFVSTNTCDLKRHALFPGDTLDLRKIITYLKRKLIGPLLTLLRMGLSPRKLALTVALGFVFGIMPIFGLASLVVSAVGYRLKLNIAALLLVCYMAGPFYLALYLPFIKMGIWLFGANDFPLSFGEITTMFRQDWLLALNKIWVANMLGIVAWGLLSMPMGLTIYFVLKPVLQVVMRRRKPQPQEDVRA